MTVAYMGILMGYAGDWDRAVELTRQALDELLDMFPGFAEVAEEELKKWQSDELAALTLEGLRMAGMDNEQA